MLYQAPSGQCFAAVLDPLTATYAAIIPLQLTLPPDVDSIAIGEAFDTSSVTVGFTEPTGFGAIIDFDYSGTQIFAESGIAGFKFAGIGDLAGAGIGQFVIKQQRSPYTAIDVYGNPFFLDKFKAGAFTKVLGYSDFNGDGKLDFILENPTNHWIKAACYDGSSFIGPSFQVYKHAQTLRSWVGATQETFDFGTFTFLFAKGPDLPTTLHHLQGSFEFGHIGLPDRKMTLLAVGPSYVPNSSTTFKKGTSPFPFSTSGDDE